MPRNWVQIKGDPSVRDFLFQQARVESLFDQRIDEVHEIVKRLIRDKGVFHIKVHYSSGQMTTWLCNDAFRYRVYVREEVFAPGFFDSFADLSFEAHKPLVSVDELDLVLNEFRRLRLTDQTVYLRNASINVINGMIGMSFSCDGAHYIDHRTFFEQLQTFCSVG
jgi:hypothetical protein